MALRTAFTVGSPSSIRLMSDASARTSPLRICFMGLTAIGWIRGKSESWSNGVLALINHYSISPCLITPSLRSLKQLLRDYHPLNFRGPLANLADLGITKVSFH